MTASGASSASRPRPRLLLSDVDGTLVTTNKVLTQATRQAVARLLTAGIRFAITSSRPPAGLRAVVEALAIDAPIAAFNGGMIVAPGDGGRVLAEYLLPSEVALRTVDLLSQYDIDAWVFTAERWMVRQPGGPNTSPINS